MNRKNTFAALSMATAALLGVSIANGADDFRTFSVANGGPGGGAYPSAGSWEKHYPLDEPEWHVATEEPYYPGAGDTATILANDTILVSGAVSVAAITVDSGGLFYIDSSGAVNVSTISISGEVDIKPTGSAAATLTAQTVSVASGGLLDILGNGSTFYATLVLDGTTPSMAIGQANGVILENATSRLVVQANATITGSGSMQAKDDAAAINIDSATLTIASSATVHGNVIIQRVAGSAYFANQGKVIADRSGTLRLDGSLTGVSDTASASSSDYRWLSTGAGATLRFDEAGTLDGDLYVGTGSGTGSRAKFEFSANIGTGGNSLLFIDNGANIDTASQGAFTFTVSGFHSSTVYNHSNNPVFSNTIYAP